MEKKKCFGETSPNPQKIPTVQEELGWKNKRPLEPNFPCPRMKIPRKVW